MRILFESKTFERENCSSKYEIDYYAMKIIVENKSRGFLLLKHIMKGIIGRSSITFRSAFVYPLYIRQAFSGPAVAVCLPTSYKFWRGLGSRTLGVEPLLFDLANITTLALILNAHRITFDRVDQSPLSISSPFNRLLIGRTPLHLIKHKSFFKLISLFVNNKNRSFLIFRV